MLILILLLPGLLLPCVLAFNFGRWCVAGHFPLTGPANLASVHLPPRPH